MRPSFWYRRRVCRRFVVGMALVAYLTTIVGLPLPAASRSSGGVPFPCQDHVCGCISAEQCWDHCCCFTSHEKLAWAHEHNVTPPEALVAEVARLIEERTPAQAKARRSCCASEGHAASRNTHSDAACEHDGCADQGSCDDHDQENSVDFLPGIMARKCGGQADYWCLSGAVSPPPSHIEWQFQWNLVAWLRLSSAPDIDVALAPPKRPPRV